MLEWAVVWALPTMPRWGRKVRLKLPINVPITVCERRLVLACGLGALSVCVGVAEGGSVHTVGQT